MTGPNSTPELVDRLFRTQAGRLVAHFARRFGPTHLDLAEEVVQDALVKALQRWPWSGVPANPEGWLFRVACHGALDIIRRRRAFGTKAPEIARAIAADRRGVEAGAGELDAALADDELRMVLMCCHPELPADARVALSLRTVGGLGVDEIARALLADPRAIAQRLVRARRRIRDLGLTFDLPLGAALAGRVDSALDVIYLLFNEGHGALAGDDLVRVDLCREALRLGRLVADAPAVSTPRAHALVSLMAFHASRLPARVGPDGELALLEDQDRRLWDAALISLGFRHLDASLAADEQTAFHLQAAIAATHASAAEAAATDWPRILDLYTSSSRSTRRRSSGSIAPWRSRRCAVRARPSGSSSGSVVTRGCAGTICCPRSGRICWRNAAMLRPLGVPIAKRSRAAARSRSGDFLNGGWRRCEGRGGDSGSNRDERRPGAHDESV